MSRTDKILIELEQFGENGWFFAKSPHLSGLLLFAETEAGIHEQIQESVELLMQAKAEMIAHAEIVTKPRTLNMWRPARQAERAIA